MAKLQNEGCLPWIAFGLIAILGFFFSNQNWLGANDHFWIWVSIAAVIGAILIFLGKTKELRWLDVSFTAGSLVGLFAGHCFA